MKKLYFLTLLCVCAEAYSQNDAPNYGKENIKKINSGSFPIDSSTKLITYLEVVHLNDSISKSELFSRGKATVAQIFKNSIVILNEDKDAGVIVGQGTIPAFVTFLGNSREVGSVTYTLTLSCKDGRYRYIITDLILSENAHTTATLEQLKNPADLSINQWKELKNDVYEKMKIIIASIKMEMNKPSPQYDKW